MPSGPPLRMHLSDILPENSAPFLCAGMGHCSQWHGAVALPSARRNYRAVGPGRVGDDHGESSRCSLRPVSSAPGAGRKHFPSGRMGQPTPGAPGRSQQQCQHQVGPRRTRCGRVRGHRMVDPKRIGAVVHAATESVSSALAGLDARFARTRASAREGYSPFSALALRAFSMICVGESKSSVLALPGATHSSRCLTTMPMFST